MSDNKEETVEPDDAVSATGSHTTTTLPSAFPSMIDEIKQLSHESIAPQNSYQIKPDFQDIFKEVPVKDIIRNVQTSTLGGKNYDADNVKNWTIKMANEINEKVRDIAMKRYRHIVQVVIGERKGQGVKSGVRCIWDPETDSCCSEIFMNDTIFCVVTVFAVFLY
ncbi:dynein light chain Tctex-type protein 2B-like [Euwallacea similis]|uniref:dynein light chain Tctex-type protein 2B-like n=1 Tax=Euwallacea similis TaxID=1736056 RepID=UPI00344D1E41